MEKLSEQVPLPACPLSSVCLHAGRKAPLQVRFQYSVPSCPHQGPGCLHLHTISAEPPAHALQTSLLPLSADSVPDPFPEVRRLTSTGTVCEPGQNRARDGNSTCQAPLSFPAANIPVSTQDEPGTEMETAQRGRKGEGWPTDGLISNPQPLLQPNKGTGAGHRSCDRAIFLLLSPQQPVLLGEMNLPIRPPNPEETHEVRLSSLLPGDLEPLSVWDS